MATYYPLTVKKAKTTSAGLFSLDHKDVHLSAPMKQ